MQAGKQATLSRTSTSRLSPAKTCHVFLIGTLFWHPLSSELQMLPCLSGVRVTSAHQRIPLNVQSFGSCNGIFDGRRAALCNHHRRIPKYAVSFEDWQRNGKADKTESGPGKRVIASLQSASFNIAPERASGSGRWLLVSCLWFMRAGLTCGGIGGIGIGGGGEQRKMPTVHEDIS